jgi:hypothetical protein
LGPRCTSSSSNRDTQQAIRVALTCGMHALVACGQRCRPPASTLHTARTAAACCGVMGASIVAHGVTQLQQQRRAQRLAASHCSHVHGVGTRCTRAAEAGLRSVYSYRECPCQVTLSCSASRPGTARAACTACCPSARRHCRRQACPPQPRSGASTGCCLTDAPFRPHTTLSGSTLACGRPDTARHPRPPSSHILHKRDARRCGKPQIVAMQCPGCARQRQGCSRRIKWIGASKTPEATT